jgi:hypothetical protein
MCPRAPHDVCFCSRQNMLIRYRRDRAFLDSIAPEVEHYVQGKIVAFEGEDDEDEAESGPN